MPATDRKERRVLVMAATLCVGLPTLAHSCLQRRVQGDLSSAASDAFGLPIEVGSAQVGLTGTLELRDLRVGSVLSADSVVAQIAPGKDGLAPSELIVERPKIRLELRDDGSNNLGDLLQRQRTPPGGASTARTPSDKRLRLRHGEVDVRIGSHGHARIEGLELVMQGQRAHGVIGQTRVELEDRSWIVRGSLRRGAFDAQRGEVGLQRLLVNGGELSLLGPRGRAVLRDAQLSYGVGTALWQLIARAGIDRPHGKVRIAGEPSVDGWNIEVDGENAPLALFGPWLPKSIDPRKSEVSGEIAVSIGARMRARVDVALRSLRMEHARLARHPIEADLRLRSQLSMSRGDGLRLATMEIDELSSGQLALSGRVEGQWKAGDPLPELASVKLELAEVACDAALDSLPQALRTSLAGLELRGSLKSRIDLLLSRREGTETSLHVDAGLDRCRAVREPVADVAALRGAYEHRMPDGRPRILDNDTPGFVDIDALPSYVPKTFVAAEDARFFQHEGFDAHQIERSLAIDVREGQLIRGGSTISQQLVKNLFLRRHRSLGRKLEEAILTWRLEDRVSKKRILEVYLNIIELGDHHTYGVEEAAQRWFGIPAEELSILQTAFLAAMTPEPTSMSARLRRASKLDDVSAARVATILRAMRRAKVISTSEYQRAKRETLVFASHAFDEPSLARAP